MAEGLPLQAHTLPQEALASKKGDSSKQLKLVTQLTGPIMTIPNVYKKEKTRIITEEEENFSLLLIFTWPMPLPSSLTSRQKQTNTKEATEQGVKKKKYSAVANL